MKGGNIMWGEWMAEFEESEREEMKKIKDKAFRMLQKLNDAKEDIQKLLDGKRKLCKK